MSPPTSPPAAARPPAAGPSLPTTRRALGTTLLVVGLALVLVTLLPTGEASHLRYATLNWHTANSLLILSQGMTVEFAGESYWRLGSLGGCNAAQTLCALPACLDFGDGSPPLTSLGLRIDTSDVNDDYYGGAIVDAAGNPIRHTYPAPGVYTASLQGCGSQRVNVASPTYRHVNNPNGPWSVVSMVDLTGGLGAASPMTSMPVFMDCVAGTVCAFDVPATDPVGASPLTWRLATGPEAGEGTVFAQPGSCQAGPPCVPTTAATIHPFTGRYEWNTAGAYVDPAVCQALYSTNVVVETGFPTFESTAVDFFIRLHGAVPPPAPTLTADPVTYLPPPFRVDLHWPPGVSTSPCPVTEYRVYRSLVSGSYGAPLASVPAPTTDYSDATIQPCRTYYYVVRALNIAGESLDSNEVTVVTDPTMGACSLSCPAGTTGPGLPDCAAGTPCPPGTSGPGLPNCVPSPSACPPGTRGPGVPNCEPRPIPCPSPTAGEIPLDGTPPTCHCPPEATTPPCIKPVPLPCPPPTSGAGPPECCPPASNDEWPRCYNIVIPACSPPSIGVMRPLCVTLCDHGQVGVEPICLDGLGACDASELGVEPACVPRCAPPEITPDDFPCVDASLETRTTHRASSVGGLLPPFRMPEGASGAGSVAAPGLGLP